MSIRNVSHDSKWLKVTFEDGDQHKYFGAWLRDNTNSGRHQNLGQRTFDLNLQDEVNINETSISENKVNIRFKDDDRLHRFDERWLRRFSNHVRTPETRRFVDKTHADEAVKLRRLEDDLGKRSGAAVPPLEHYTKLLQRLALPTEP